MNDAESRIQARKEKLLKAAGLIGKSLEQYRRTRLAEVSSKHPAEEGEGCMPEFCLLIGHVIQWLDDEDYYYELAWEIEGKPPV